MAEIVYGLTIQLSTAEMKKGLGDSAEHLRIEAGKLDAAIASYAPRPEDYGRDPRLDQARKVKFKLKRATEMLFAADHLIPDVMYRIQSNIFSVSDVAVSGNNYMAGRAASSVLPGYDEDG